MPVIATNEPDLFSYAALSREDEAAAREDAALIKAHMKTAAESIIAVGLALKRQKDRLPHGMFLPWIAAEFEMHSIRRYSMLGSGLINRRQYRTASVTSQSEVILWHR